jgi:hypothetical protein
MNILPFANILARPENIYLFLAPGLKPRAIHIPPRWGFSVDFNSTHRALPYADALKPFDIEFPIINIE